MFKHFSNQIKTNIRITPAIFVVLIIVMLAFFVSLKTTPGIVVAAPTTGLIAHWAFDEGTGTAAADAAGNGNTATLTNGASWTTGKVGSGALLLDGTDDLAIVEPASFNGTGDMTFTAWVNKSLTLGHERAFIIANTMNQSFAVSRASKWVCFSSDGATSGCTKANSFANFDTWQHIAVTRPANGQAVQIYINGAPSGLPVNTGFPKGGTKWAIGGAPNFPKARPHATAIDEVRVYNRILLPSEILDIYNDTGTPPPPDITPPVISDVLASSIRSTSAVITWATDEPTDAQVEYGITENYGNTSPLNLQLLKVHSQILSGLNPNTAYHYRVKSKDAVGNLGVSGDFTFMTTELSAQTAPNIIFILADDLAWRAVGAYGQIDIQTPNIDKLAQEGMLFTDAYSGAPICCPARSSLLTGKHTGHARHRHNRQIHPETGENLPESGPLSFRDETIAEVLKGAGYNTGIIGKWHTGGAETSGRPNFQGFDYFFGHLNQSDGAVKYYPTSLWKNTTKISVPKNPDGTSAYVEDIYTQESIDFITANQNNPFFLHITFNTPHLPLLVPTVDPYANKPWTYDQKTFAAMITRMDQHIGQIMATLKNLGMDENTLVVFTSDNGPEADAIYAEARFNTTGPLRGLKKQVYEGGIRVPFIARWPGKIQENTQNQEPIATYDLLPTFAELVNVPPSRGIDGISITPELFGAGDVEREYLFWEVPIVAGGGTQAVRMGDWKGVRHFAPSYKFELFNLAQDIGETNNLAFQNPAIVQKMEAIMDTGRTLGVQDGFPIPAIDPKIVCPEIEYLNGVDLLSYSGSSAACAELTRGQVGEKIYTDSMAVISSLPVQYEGDVLVRHADADKSFAWSTFMRMAVRQPSSVAVAHQANATTLPSWLASWAKTGEIVRVTGLPEGEVVFDIYSKSFEQNATVFLGGNAQDGGNASRSYFVLVDTGSPTPDPTKLVAHWTFDETTGVIAHDTSGYQYDGLLYNGSFYSQLAKIGNGPAWVAGKFDNALRFDGVDDSVYADTGTTWRGDYTVALWAKTTKQFQAGTLFSNLQNFLHTAKRNSMQIQVNSTTGNYQVFTTRSFKIAPVDTSDWQHIVVTLSGQTLKTYSNGVLTNTYQLDLGESNFFRDYLIGVDARGRDYFNGQIDEVRVYQRAFTDLEVSSLFGGGL